MANQNPQFLLKVLSGPHQGAEVLLAEGDYVVGSSEEADIILTDVAFEPKHFKLSFKPPNVTLSLLSGAVFLQGKKIDNEAVSVPFFQFLTIGSTHIIIGPEGEGWPLLTALDAPILELNDNQVITEESLSDVNGVKSLEASSNTLADALAVGNNPSVKDKLIEPISESEKEKITAIMPRLWAWIGGMVVFLVIIVVGCVGFYRYASIRHTTVNPILSIEQRKSQLLELLEIQGASKHIQVQAMEETLVVSGYVNKESTRLSLRRALSLADPHAVIRIQSEESIIQGAAVILEQFKLPIMVSMDASPGFLAAVGYAPSEVIWRKAQSLMLQDIEGLLGLKDGVITAEKFRLVANSVLKPVGLSGAITFQAKPDFIVAEGSLTRTQCYAWESALNDLNQRFASQIVIKDAVFRSDPQAIDNQYFDGEIESLTIGPFGFIALKNGQKYFAGALLPSGYTIVALSHEGVTLRKGDQSVLFKPQAP